MHTRRRIHFAIFFTFFVDESETAFHGFATRRSRREKAAKSGPVPISSASSFRSKVEHGKALRRRSRLQTSTSPVDTPEMPSSDTEFLLDASSSAHLPRQLVAKQLTQCSQGKAVTPQWLKAAQRFSPPILSSRTSPETTTAPTASVGAQVPQELFRVPSESVRSSHRESSPAPRLRTSTRSSRRLGKGTKQKPAWYS